MGIAFNAYDPADIGDLPLPDSEVSMSATSAIRVLMLVGVLGSPEKLLDIEPVPAKDLLRRIEAVGESRDEPVLMRRLVELAALVREAADRDMVIGWG